MKIQRKSLFCSGRGWIFFVLQFLWWNIAPPPFYDDLLAYLQLLHWLRGGLAVPAECSADYQHPAIDDLFFRQSRYALWLARQRRRSAAVYAAFAIAGPVADSGCRHQACSDIWQAFCCSLKGKIASLWNWRRDSGHKAIANPGFGQQMLRPCRIGLQLLSQMTHMIRR